MATSASSITLTNPIDGETMNHIILIGNVGRDPEARGADGGIAKFSLAVDSRKKGAVISSVRKADYYDRDML